MLTDIAWISQFILPTENGWVKCIVGYTVPHIFPNETGDQGATERKHIMHTAKKIWRRVFIN